MVLEKVKVSLLVMEAGWEQVEDLGSLDRYRALPGPADCCRRTPGHGCGYRVQSPAIASMPLEVVAADESAAELPEEAHHVPLPPALLAVDLEQLQLFQVVQPLQHWVPDPVNETVLHSLQAVDAWLEGDHSWLV